MTKTMRAARYHGPQQPLRVEEVPIPPPGPGEALVRVRAAGLCHTELHFLSGLLNLGVTPIILGHEMAGEVAEVGAQVSGVRPGDRVVVGYYVGCGSCHWCRTGHENLCDHIVAELGFISDGGLAEYVKAPARNLIPLPDGLGFDEAATLGCSATTAVHAARGIAGVQAGETAVVYGVGGVGFALIQYCKLAGCRVIAVGRNEAKLRVARELGADATISARDANVADEVRSLTSDQGAEVVFELVGTAETMPQAFQSLRKRGKLVFIGYSEDTFSVHPIMLVINEAVVTASVGNSLDELAHAVELAGRGQIKATIDRTVRLDDVNETLEALKQGEVIGRAVVRP